MTDKPAPAPQETVYLNTSDVLITHSRAVIQNKTYAMSNITSVAMLTKPPNKEAHFLLLATGAIILVIGLSGGNGSILCTGIGALFVLLGILMLISARTQYIVRIGSASGESNALTSIRQETVQHIVDAMNEAIIRRG